MKRTTATFAAATMFVVAFANAPLARAWDEAPFPFEMLAEGVNIVLSVSDADKAIEFYGDILGLKRIPNIDLPGSQATGAGTMLRFMGGVSEIKLIVLPGLTENYPDGIDRGRGIRLLTIFLDASKKDGIAERLEQAGYATDRLLNAEGEVMSNGIVQDQDGNELNIVFLPPGRTEDENRRMVIGLTVGDSAASREFYGELLGLQELAPGSAGLDAFMYMFQAGPTSIRFWNENSELPAYTGAHTQAYGMHYIQFIVTDVDAVFEEMKGKGATVVREPFPLGKLARIAMIADPDGVVIEFAGPPKAE